MLGLNSVAQTVNPLMEDELLNDLQPSIGIVALLNNLIASMGHVDYTPRSKLDKLFRILRDKVSLKSMQRRKAYILF